MSDILETIGLSKEELQERVVDKIARSVLGNERIEHEYETNASYPVFDDSPLAKQLQAHVRSRVDSAIDRIATERIDPTIKQLVEDLALQKTNDWGEAIGAKTTFVEYLTSRANEYLTETVDSDGKPNKHSRDYGRTYCQPRIMHAVDKYLNKHIQDAMKAAVESMNSLMLATLKKSVETKLKEVSTDLGKLKIK